MVAAMDYIGGDGFLLIGSDAANAAWNDGVIDGLVPELQKAGVLRNAYASGLNFRQALQQSNWISRAHAAAESSRRPAATTVRRTRTQQKRDRNDNGDRNQTTT